MWTIGQKIGGWTVETGPCASQADAFAHGRAIVDGTRWKVLQSPNGKWWVLIQ